MEQHPLLFEPLTVNKMQLRNRIVFPAVHLNYTHTGEMTDQLVSFYSERAAGGAGLLIAGGCAISPLAGGPNLISIMKDEDIDGLSRLGQAAHDHGAALGVQLYHAGAYSHRMLIGRQAVSSFTHTSRFTKDEARGLELDEIPGVQDEFAQAALRAKQAGLDMVEILGSAGYLICQFLSPVINQRQDEYGGPLENRMRFGLEVVKKVRRAVGPDFCVGIRVAGNDFVPGSHTNSESARFAKACQEAGADMINVTGGWHETKVPQITADVPPGGFSYLARGVKNAVTIPVCASNLIHNADVAEDVLARGDGDLVCLARPLITDPELPNKVKAGKPELTAPCVSCNQGCFDSIFKLAPVGCMVNPRAGKEATIPQKPEAAAQPKRVVVAGGGPAGCQAALTAAQRGHQVVLLEKGAALGGQPSWYAGPTEKPDFARIGPYFAANLEQAGVDVRLGVEADAGYIAGLEPGEVIVATGATPIRPDIPGLDSPNVIDAWDLLQGKKRPRGRVVVIGGGAVGLETALFVAAKGALTPDQTHFLTLFRAEAPEVIDALVGSGSHQVTVIEALPKIGKGIGLSTKWVVLSKIKRFGVTVRTKSPVIAVEPGGVRINPEQGEELVPADTVVVAVGANPVDQLAGELAGRGLSVQTIGDAAGAGSVLLAIAQGFKAGREV